MRRRMLNENRSGKRVALPSWGGLLLDRPRGLLPVRRGTRTSDTGRAYAPSQRFIQPITSRYQSSELAGFRIQWFSSGK